ncbi:MAG: family 1 glycosylhydrolase [Actinomycetota bacterium]|nr:family 1 glycosylhydrolase [Actinomycetota bacterium]
MHELSRMPFIGAFESTYLPAHDVDVLETSGHATRWRDDLDLLRAHGVTRLRYPIRWHRIEPAPGAYDWGHTDQVMAYMRSEGFEPIVDLVHHTSYPRWLTGAFADPRFGTAYERYCEAFAERYPWVREYTAFNEPFATLFLSGHEAIWPPYHHGVDGFVGLLRNVLPSVARVTRRYRELLPEATHVWVDSCEGHTALEPAGEEIAALADDRRFFALDALLGRASDRDRPFVGEVVRAGGADLLEMEPGFVDVLGLDYYAHHEWAYGAGEGDLLHEIAAGRRHPLGPGHPQRAEFRGVTPAPDPQGLAELIRQYAEHTGLPLILGETNMSGSPFDRATWLKHTLEQVEQARAAGAPIDGYCWFGFLDSLDWISLLERADRSIDPVGVIWLDEELVRHQSSVSRSYSAAAAGTSSADLPAYRLSDHTAEHLAGLLPLMAHYEWLEPPADEVAIHSRGRLTAVDETKELVTLPRHDELVVFSHLPWDHVYQRPQHLISRLARGRRTWFVEEPRVSDVDRPRLAVERRDAIQRVWLEVPGPQRLAGFDDPDAVDYPEAVAELLGSRPGRTVWLYTPLALPYAQLIDRSLLVYDVMDDLANFAHASPTLRGAQDETLRVADLVFTGGRSIHAGVRGRTASPVHLFPSGVDPEHYEPARAMRKRRERPVAGYVGVIDERIDLELVAGLAERLPDWDIEMVGPIFKIDPADVPRALNVRYPGKQPYEALPAVMAGFDVALMPFALNDATRSISPTKNLEYLAAGLPVVSTRIPDVVAQYDTIVDLQDDAEGFATACRQVLEHPRDDRDRKVEPILHDSRWDTIASRMQTLMDRRLEALSAGGAVESNSRTRRSGDAKTRRSHT